MSSDNRTDAAQHLEPALDSATQVVSRVQAAARWKRKRTLHSRAERKIFHKTHALREALDTMPEEGFSPDVTSTTRLCSQLLAGVLRLGKAHVTQAWPHAGDWPPPPPDLARPQVPVWATGKDEGDSPSTTAPEEAQPSKPPVSTPPTMCLHLPPPQSAAMGQQLGLTPPVSSFRALQLHACLGHPDGDGPMVALTLPPCERSLVQLVRRVASQLHLSAASVRQLIKLPDVLLTV